MDRDEVMAELRRVAQELQATSLSWRQFSQLSHVSAATVKKAFGTWNQAVMAVGLQPLPRGSWAGRKHRSRPDEEFLFELLRVSREVGRKPTMAELRARGRFGESPYLRRWGSLSRAYAAALARFEPAALRAAPARGAGEPEAPLPAAKGRTLPPHGGAREPRHASTGQGHEPLDFRGLRLAPGDREGVLYLFGMVSSELGVVLESVRSGYPEGLGQRWSDAPEPGWRRVRLGFEYRSSGFREHGHSRGDADLVVCWIHDWPGCPIAVLELRSAIARLPRGPGAGPSRSQGRPRKGRGTLDGSPGLAR